MNLAEWIQIASQRLARAGIASSRLEAQLLAAHILMVDRTYVLTHPEAELNELAAETLLQRRESQEPLAYILGYREFFGRRFRVDPSVLIPRQETETLVEAALSANLLSSNWGERQANLSPLSETSNQDAPNDQRQRADAPRVLDIGTGSGCIAITLKLERPDWDVWACDISGAALQVARENAETLAAEITFRHSDLFAAFQGETFDLIVSNPPYIGHDEPLPDEIRSHEPSTALFAENNGLEIYQRLAATFHNHLRPNGTIVLEIGQSQGPAVARLFNGEIIQDLSGNDRIVIKKMQAIEDL